MKKYIYKLIHKFGYKIINKKKITESELLSLKKYDVTENFDLLFRSRQFFRELEKKFNDISVKSHKNGLIIQFNGIQFFVETPEELYIIKEVFVENDYNFELNDTCVLIDIGTNIGVASLFFSNLDSVKKIYCFEPVKETYEQAKYNFSLNDALQKVVSIENVGLGNSNREEVFLFDNEIKGNSGIRGHLSPSYQNNSKASEITVQICNASQKIQEIITNNPNEKIVIKMDCEGAEYEIFEDLAASSVLDNISIIMLEWHDKGPQAIEKVLRKNNFSFFSRNLTPISGMIYAYKNE